MADGRAPDDAVAWFAHMRLSEKIASGASQADIAEATNIPASAINLLLKAGKGVGAGTVPRLAKYLGFPTRGQMIDAADEWWGKGGYEYAVRQLQRQMEERMPRADRKPKKSKKKPAASKATPSGSSSAPPGAKKTA